MERPGHTTMGWAQSGGSFHALADGPEHIHNEEKRTWVTLDPLCWDTSGDRLGTITHQEKL